MNRRHRREHDRRARRLTRQINAMLDAAHADGRPWSIQGLTNACADCDFRRHHPRHTRHRGGPRRHPSRRLLPRLPRRHTMAGSTVTVEPSRPAQPEGT
jgi:hypothetical protein